MRSKVTRQVELVGGPRDGDSVPYVGPQYREPIPSPVRYYPGELPKLSELPELEVRLYALHWRWVDDEPVGKYVLATLDIS